MSERPVARAAGLRAYSLSAALGAVSFALPHFAFLLLTDMQPFFQRETTLWMTWVLLLASALYVGFAFRHRWRSAIMMVGGTTAGVLLYLVTTVDLRGTQLYGSISPLFLWAVAIGSSLVLTTPVVLIGVLIGGKLGTGSRVVSMQTLL